MTNDLVLYFSKNLLWNALFISSPVILTAFVLGLLLSILQVVTQMQDASLSFVPKILGVVISLILAGDWMLQSLLQFCKSSLLSIPGVLQ